jgi:hypothetical protein
MRPPPGLPRHEPAPNGKADPRRPSLFKQLVWFVIDWIKISWKDVLAMAILGAAALSVCLHYFPDHTIPTVINMS